MTLTAFSQLVRPKSCLLGSGFLLLSIYLSNQSIPILPVLWAFFTVLLVVAFSFIINDYCDLELDRLAKPQRPLPSGAISLPTAHLLMFVCVAGALLFSLLLGLTFMLFTLLMLLLSASYSLWFKRTVLIGHLVVAVLNSSIVIFGAMVMQTFNQALLSAAVGIFIYTFAHEILYAVEDREGDLQGGVRTLATQFSLRTSLTLFSIAGLILAFFALLPWWIGGASLWYGAAALICCTIPISVSVFHLMRDPLPEVIMRSRRTLIMVRYLGLIPLLLLQL